MRSDDAFNILALDGGGIRGVYGAHVLARLEDTLRAPVRERFDLIAGTTPRSFASTNSPLYGTDAMRPEIGLSGVIL